MPLSRDDVLSGSLQRGLRIPESSIASATAAINSGKHLAVISVVESEQMAIGFAELLADSAARADLCTGWLNLYATAAALVRLEKVVRMPFLNDLWLVVTEPSPVAMTRVVDEVRGLWRDSDSRLLMATTAEAMRSARLSPAARRAVIRVVV